MSKNASRKSSKRESRFTRKQGNDNFEPIEIIAIPEQRVVEPLHAITRAQDRYMASIRDNIITFGIGPAGTGKAQPLSEPVLTPDRWVIMGDINVGDTVISEKGLPIKVMDTFFSESLEMYEVTFSDGSSTRCCIDHLWEVQTVKMAKRGNFKVMPLRDMLYDISNHKLPSKHEYKYRIRLSDPIEFEEKELLIDPWSMGYILGNGSSKNYNLTVSVGNDDFDEIVKKFKPPEILSSRVKIDGVYDIAISSEYRKYYNTLELHNVKSIDKFIPEIYLMGSVEQRKGLLAGLLDSDGSCGNNKCRFSTSSKQLAIDVLSLIRSLGGYAKLSELNRCSKGNTEYNIQLRTPFNPFTLARKANNYTVIKTDCIKATKRIVSATPIGIMPGKCLVVDNPSSLYITKDFTVTHNTFVAAAMAADMLREKKIDKIIITRPAVEAGESFGFLPGELEEKYAPYIDPFRDILNERLGKSQVEYLIKHKRIEAKPLAFMRGCTLKNCWAILDEAQNTTPSQMKLFLTRIGENCKVIVDGDTEQKDIKSYSGLADAVIRLASTKRVGIVDFSPEDIVRSGIVRDIIKAYAA